MKSLLFFVLIAITLNSCEHGDYHDKWECPEKVIPGRYFRNLEAIENGPTQEFIELNKDGTYHYFCENYFDTIHRYGNYNFEKATGGDNNYCYVVLDGLNLPVHIESKSSQDISFTGLYGIVGDKVYIDANPEMEEDAFVLKR